MVQPYPTLVPPVTGNERETGGGLRARWGSSRRDTRDSPNPRFAGSTACFVRNRSPAASFRSAAASFNNAADRPAAAAPASSFDTYDVFSDQPLPPIPPAPPAQPSPASATPSAQTRTAPAPAPPADTFDADDFTAVAVRNVTQSPGQRSAYRMSLEVTGSDKVLTMRIAGSEGDSLAREINGRKAQRCAIWSLTLLTLRAEHVLVACTVHMLAVGWSCSLLVHAIVSSC